ncbi:hypothetical protein J2X31_001044 [Flavobacterium arsenatis]|uniref:Uncharacterized protein n=1 Tax=Flavobacterium arsenatis TaxID=1484332 RepID=A0ABU1TM45_9FLAO|nr:hypothetical protein [Flavobacterium arsenatis]
MKISSICKIIFYTTFFISTKSISQTNIFFKIPDPVVSEQKI